MIIRRVFIVTLLLTIWPTILIQTSVKAVERSHLGLAKILVKQLQPENTSYQHKNGYIKWKGQNGANDYESHTDCCGFLTALLEKAYGLTPDYFKQWLGKRRPLAKTYHEAIMNEQGFKHIQLIREVEPGDIIAIMYPAGSEDTGHIMIVAETPQGRKASRPKIEGTEQWEIAVIDSSKTGHGKMDTRRRDDGTFGSGAGEGILRVYTDRKGPVVGYTWSTFDNSEYYDQMVRHLAIGRLDLPAKR
jgi:hypothetical protein